MITLEWQMSGAKCKKCGNTVIVQEVNHGNTTQTH